MMQEPSSALAIFSWNSAARTRALVDGLPHETILIVSPFPEALSKDVFPPQARIRRLEGLPQTAGEALELQRYSHTGLFSLTEPTPLLFDLYPGLREKPPLEVPGLSTSTVCDALTAPQTPLHVIIDMPGYEHEIVQFLKAAGCLDTIENLTVRAMQDPCFAEVDGTATFLPLMTDLGFQITAQDDSDPDWPVLTFAVDRAARKIAELESELSQHANSLKDRDATLAERDEKISELTKELAESRDAVKRVENERETAKAALAESVQNLETAKESLANRANSLKNREAALAERDEKISELTKELAESCDAVKRVENERETAKAALAESVQNLETAKTSLVNRANSLKNREAALAERDEKISELTKELAESGQNLESAKSSLVDRSNRLKERDAALSERNEILRRKVDEIGGLRTRIEQLQETCERSHSERDALRDDLRLAIDMAQAGRRDLEELRARFTQLSDERDSLVDLLQALTPKLREAAGYLQQLPRAETTEATEATKKTTPKPSKTRAKRKKKAK